MRCKRVLARYLSVESQAGRAAAREAEREREEGGPRPAPENVISRLGGETNSCCQPDLVKAAEETEWN